MPCLIIFPQRPACILRKPEKTILGLKRRKSFITEVRGRRRNNRTRIAARRTGEAVAAKNTAGNEFVFAARKLRTLRRCFASVSWQSG
jgi:hypothetical protein